MKCNTINLITAAAMTGTTVVNSSALPLDQIYGFAIQATWTGTPTGTIKLQASSDAPLYTTQVSNGGPYTITDWTDIADSSYSISGSDGNYMWNFNGAFYRFVRVVYTNLSGTGVLSAIVCVKGV